MNKIKNYYKKYSEYIRVDIAMYALMITMIFSYFIYTFIAG